VSVCHPYLLPNLWSQRAKIWDEDSSHVSVVLEILKFCQEAEKIDFKVNSKCILDDFKPSLRGLLLSNFSLLEGNIGDGS